MSHYTYTSNILMLQYDVIGIQHMSESIFEAKVGGLADARYCNITKLYMYFLT